MAWLYEKIQPTWNFLCSMVTINRFTSRKMEYIFKENFENATNVIIHDHHLVKRSRLITLDKVTSTESDSILILKALNKPS